MHLQKLITVLRAMDRPLVKRLSVYMHSLYFDVPVSAVDLFDYLKKVHPLFPENKIAPDVISKHVKKLSTAAKQAKAGTELLKAIDGFITIEHWNKEKPNALPHLIYGLKELNLYDRSQTESDKAAKILDSDNEQDINNFYLRHLLTESTFNGFETKLKRNPDNDISPVIKTLDEFYALKKLRYICETITRNSLLGAGDMVAEMKPIMNILAPYNDPNYPYVFVFMHVFMMMTAADFDTGFGSYQIIQDMARKQKAGSLPRYVVESIDFAVNWCLQWNAKGYRDAGASYLWWIDFKIKHGLLLERGQLLPITYRNIVSLSVQGHRELKWSKNFLEQYAHCISKGDRPTNYSFAKALYLFASGDHEAAMPFFQMAQAKDEPIFNVIIRRWQFMCLYEYDPSNTQTLMAFLHAFDKYILRNEPALHRFKPMFTTFIHYSNRLLREKGKTERVALLAGLKNQEYFAGKEWLMLKINPKNEYAGLAHS